MLKSLKWLLSAALLTGQTIAGDVPSVADYTETTLNTDVNFKVYTKADLENQTLYITLAATRSKVGWLGFGFAEQDSGHMKGSDMVTVTLTGDSSQVHDRYAEFAAITVADDSSTVSYAGLTASIDTHNDYEIIGTALDGDTYYLALSRDFTTGDDQDRDICSGQLCRIIWAYGGYDASVGYHGTNRGTGRIDLRGNAETRTLPTGTSYWSFTVPSYTIPTKRTTYGHTSFSIGDANLPSARHIIGFHVIPSAASKNNVHHVTLTGYKSETAFLQDLEGTMYDKSDSSTYTTENSGTDRQGYFYAWGLGAEVLVMPDDVGFRASTDQDDINHFLMEVHYDNPDTTANVVDQTEVRIYYTETMRTHDAFVLTVGDPQVQISSDITATELHFQGTCPSACTANMPSDHTFNFFKVFLHEHYFGHKIYIDKYDGSGTFDETIARIDFWDNGFQDAAESNFTLSRNEALHTHCYYNVSHHGTDVEFGEGTDEEMCMAFLIGYPRLDPTSYNAFDFCGKASSDQTVCSIDSNYYMAAGSQLDDNQGGFNDPLAFGVTNLADNNGTWTSKQSQYGVYLGSSALQTAAINVGVLVGAAILCGAHIEGFF